MTDAVDSRARNSALRIAAIYLVLGIAWILFSDGAVQYLIPDHDLQFQVQHLKGIAYVALTALLVFVLVRGNNRELRRSIERAEAGELRIRDLFLANPSPMWVVDERDGTLVSVNDAAVERYGYSQDEFARLSLRELVAPDEHGRLDRLLASRMLGNGEVGTWQCRAKDGTTIYAHLTASRVDYHGRAAALILAQDETEAVLARRTIERSEARLRQLHDSLADTLWFASTDGSHMLYVNPAFERLYGFPGWQLAEEPGLWLRCVLPEDRQVAEDSARALTTVGFAEAEYRIRRSDGAIRWVLDRKKRIVDENGTPVMIGGSAQDITPMKDAQRALQQMNEVLEERIRQRTAELEFANAELEAFGRTAAHDLKSPLNAVLGFAQILRGKHAAALGAAGTELVVHIERGAQSMTQLVDDLLALSKVTGDPLQIVEVDLSELARGIVSELRSREPARSATVEIHDGLHAHADAGLLASLMGNLLGNAWKYSARTEHAYIEVGCSPGLGARAYFVRDNGAGFDLGKAGKLFEPFSRLHSSSEFDGTGIGLATCKRIVKRHGGNIWASSAVGEGSTFYFTLGERDRAPVEHAPGPSR